MKKLFYLMWLGAFGIACVTSCEDDPKNPGDFSLKSELTAIKANSLRSGNVHELKVADVRDTIYQYLTYISEVVLDENGNPMLDKDGNEVTTTHAEMLEAIGPKRQGKIYDLEPIIIDWTQDDYNNNIILDTILVELKSNAKWVTGTSTVNPTGAAQFYSIINGTNSGGGDGFINVEFKWCRPKTFTVKQPVFTQDSSIVYFVNFEVHGATYPR